MSVIGVDLGGTKLALAIFSEEGGILHRQAALLDGREGAEVGRLITEQALALREAWAREATELGAGEVLLTSMDRDGTTDGYDLELTRGVSEAVSVPVIASGGAGELDHLVDAIERGHADAVLCASIFHYGAYTVAEAKRRMEEAGIAVRST